MVDATPIPHDRPLTTEEWLLIRWLLKHGTPAPTYREHSHLRTFSNAPRFEVLPDGTLYARAGVQTNCGGIAGIHVRITPTPSDELICLACEGAASDDLSAMPGQVVPAEYRDAVCSGARMAFDARAVNVGVRFELIDALVHPIDANESKFKIAGITVLSGWFERYARRSSDGA